MAAPKGHTQYGGRKKGTPNKKTMQLLERCEALNVDPFHIQLLFANGDWAALGYKSEFDVKLIGENAVEERVISPELRQKSAAEVCQYLYAKRKAIEHSLDSPPEVAEKFEEIKDLSDKELKKLVKDE